MLKFFVTKTVVVVCSVFIFAFAASAQADKKSPVNNKNPDLRIMSWNVSENAFVKNPHSFNAFVKKTQATILLLDEVSPLTSPQQIREALAGLKFDEKSEWHINYGISGGRQREVIVSRLPIEQVPEFATVIPYPEKDRDKIREDMEAANELNPAFTMDDGIPLNGVIVLDGKRRLLVVSLDLQCCGNDPSSWQEYRRRVETSVLRDHIGNVLARTKVDGIIVAGDFNLVGSAIPLVITAGPYQQPNAGLLVADLRQLDGEDAWTWDGRGTAFPSNALDFLLYSPHSLELTNGYIFSSEDLSLDEIEELSIHTQSSRQLSDHLPLVAEFKWR